jgi:serine/threonine protein kinase
MPYPFESLTRDTRRFRSESVRYKWPADTYAWVALAAELDPAWAAQRLELTRQEGRTILVLRDPGGELLDQVLDRDQGQPLEQTRFLRIALGLVTALGQVHRHGLIHKDIKPANVHADGDSNVWLTGFGIASQLPHESQPPAPPEIIAGTLAYMAPEQTGCMNHSIDTRSDLHSLGVSFYQMIAGRLPFAATDALEWVHCHIARQPKPPGVQTARRIVLPLESMGHEVLNHHLVGDNAWPTLLERAYRQVPRKTPRPNVCTAN